MIGATPTKRPYGSNIAISQRFLPMIFGQTTAGLVSTPKYFPVILSVDHCPEFLWCFSVVGGFLKRRNLRKPYDCFNTNLVE